MPQQEYNISYEPLFTAVQLIDVQAVIEQVTDPWYNQTLIGVGDGLFRIELEDAPAVGLGPRQAFTVPAGMLHRPVVPVRTAVLMIEKAG
ncbi:MAG TPA: hypothetical protein VMU94_08640 [Streptosporangiaceae bacterium]|nr:hypothetical protein [Streptosporangiaceae bacterium]